MTTAISTRKRTKFEQLWSRVQALAKEAPYINQSPRYAHRDAARVVGRQMLTPGEMTAWDSFTTEHIRGLSNYSGD